MNAAEAAVFLLEHDNYTVVTHRRPDGDTLGSAAALILALRRAGKRAYIQPNPEVTEKYLPFYTPYLAPDGFVPECTAAVDVADEKLFPAGFSGPVDINVDHHPSNTRYARELYLRPDYASCSQAVLELVKLICGSVTREEADALYCGLSTDTGCFLYSNTDAEAHRAAAELCGYGADVAGLNQLLFRTFTPARLALEGLISSTLRRRAGGKVVIAVVTLDMLAKSGAKEDDCDDLASIAGRMEGCRIAVTVRQMTENHCKVSVRSPGLADCSAICRKFGGGGHAGAAGCELDGTPDEVADILGAAAEEALD